MDLSCAECGEKATNFHSKCCGAHMEGVITENGELQVACEVCGKYIGTFVEKNNLKYILCHIEQIVSNWDNRESSRDFEDFEEIYQIICSMIGEQPKNLEELYEGGRIKGRE